MLFFFNKNMTSCFFNFFTTVLVHIRGRSRIFSRGGGGGMGGFSKKIESFVDFLFRLTNLIFRALPKHQKDPVLARFCAPQAKF